MSKVFSFSTPLPLQPEFVDTMPPTVPKVGTSHGQQPVATQRPMATSRSCAELGLCQQRAPACQGCDHQQERAWRSPLTLEGPYHPKPLRFRLGLWWSRHWVMVTVWLIVAACLAWSVGLTAFVLGYFGNDRVSHTLSGLFSGVWAAFKAWSLS